MLRQTEYFISLLHNYNQGELAIVNVKSKLDAFLDEHGLDIEEIVEQKLDFIIVPLGNNCQMYALITFSYFLKD